MNGRAWHHLVPAALAAAGIIAYVPGDEPPILAAILLMMWHIAVLRMSGRGRCHMALRGFCTFAGHEVARQAGRSLPGRLTPGKTPHVMLAGR